MKKLLLMAAPLLMSFTATGALRGPVQLGTSQMDIPARFLISGETKTLEWGCPIDNEFVEAENKKSALNQLISQCLEQVNRAARAKPEVAGVIQASVISPDVAFREERKGLHVVNGTIFLETVVSMVKSGK